MVFVFGSLQVDGDPTVDHSGSWVTVAVLDPGSAA